MIRVLPQKFLIALPRRKHTLLHTIGLTPMLNTLFNMRAIADRTKLDPLLTQLPMINPQIITRARQVLIRNLCPGEAKRQSPHATDLKITNAFTVVMLTKITARDHHMRMRISITLVVNNPVRYLTFCNQFPRNIVPHQVNLLLTRQNTRYCKSKTIRQLRRCGAFMGALTNFNIVPQTLRRQHRINT